jgi:hypothetical protein
MPAPASRAQRVPAKPHAAPVDPEPHGFTEHRAWKERRAKAAHDQKSTVGADGLTTHERERAAAMPPTQRAKFVVLCKSERARRARHAR